MRFGKFLVIPSLVIALIVVFLIPSETLAVENNVVETDLQVKQLSEQRNTAIGFRIECVIC